MDINPNDADLELALSGVRPTPDLAARWVQAQVLGRFGTTIQPIVLGRFEIRERIGAGASAVVYRAQDPVLEREVALKALRPDVVDADGRGPQGWLEECRALARVDHPNVVTVFEAGIEHEQPFMVMELIDGPTLRSWMRPDERSWRAVVAQFIAVGRGLSAIHAEGIVHRDFKPDNVLIDGSGRPKVADLGLAVGSDNDPRPSTAGTPKYMAPEQIADGVATQQSDQYAFCVTMAEALGGTPPDAVAPPQTPRWLRRAIDRGLSDDPKARWPSVSALVDALESGAKRRRRIAIGTAAVAGVGVAAAVVWPAVSPRSCSVPPRAWTSARKQQVQAAMLAVDRPYADQAWIMVERRLDAYAHELAVAHCHTTSPEFEAQVDACLGDREQALEDLVDVLAAPDSAIVTNAASMVFGLPSVHSCADPQQLAGNVAMRVPQRWEAVQVHTRRSRVLWMRGDLDGAIAVARTAVDTAESFADRSLRARTMTWLGQMLARAGEIEQAVELWQQAYLLALEAGDDGATTKISEQLARQLGANLRRFDEGLTWARTAAAWGVRKGATPREISVIEEATGDILGAAGRYEEALEAFDRALAANRSIPEPEPLVEAEILASKGNLLVSLGRLDQARTISQQARDTMVEHLGPDHPQGARPLDSLAALEQDPQRALELAQRALEIREGGLGDDHPNVVVSRGNVAMMLEEVGRLDEADVLYAKAISAMRRQGHPMVGQLLDAHAGLLGKRGDLNEADARYAEAAAALEAVVGAEHPLIGGTYERWADNDDALGRVEGARRKRRRAIEILEPSVGADHPDVRALRSRLVDGADG